MWDLTGRKDGIRRGKHAALYCRLELPLSHFLYGTSNQSRIREAYWERRLLIKRILSFLHLFSLPRFAGDGAETAIASHRKGSTRVSFSDWHVI